MKQLQQISSDLFILVKLVIESICGTLTPDRSLPIKFDQEDKTTD